MTRVPAHCVPPGPQTQPLSAEKQEALSLPVETTEVRRGEVRAPSNTIRKV